MSKDVHLNEKMYLSVKSFALSLALSLDLIILSSFTETIFHSLLLLYIEDRWKEQKL